MHTPRPRKYIRRYTHLPALLHMLHQRQITLLDPANWEDTNDAYFLWEYKRKKGFKSVLALYFSEAAEIRTTLLANSPWKKLAEGAA